MKEILGYEGFYFACKDGKIWANKSNKRPNGCYLRPWLVGNGYESVMLYKNGKPSKYLVHRIIAQTYIPNSKKLPEVNHKNANRLDNRPENLEWVTSTENKQHAIKRGLYKNLCTLNERQVLKIRSLYKTGLYKQIELAKMFKTPQTNVSSILRRKSWVHI